MTGKADADLALLTIKKRGNAVTKISKVRSVELFACDAGWRNYHFVKLITEDGIIGWSEFDEGVWFSWCRCCNPASLGAGGGTERLSARANLCRTIRRDAAGDRWCRRASAGRDRERPARRESKTARCALLRIARRKNSRSYSRLLVALRHL